METKVVSAGAHTPLGSRPSLLEIDQILNLPLYNFWKPWDDFYQGNPNPQTYYILTFIQNNSPGKENPFPYTK